MTKNQNNNAPSFNFLILVIAIYLELVICDLVLTLRAYNL